MHTSLLRIAINCWPPLLGAGIRVRHISADFRTVHVILKMGWLNRNYVGTHFGGSLFAMTDPFYMLMLLHNLGKGYIVWDQAAQITFIKPGRGVVSCEFRLDQTLLDAISSATANGQKHLQDFVIDIRDARGEVVASVTKTLYIRQKQVKA